MNLIYILLSPEAAQAAEAKGSYEADSLQSEGFIHASEARQLNRVVNKYYADAPELALLTIDPHKIISPLKWEPISSGDFYPHIYGPLNWDAVTAVTRIQPRADGVYEISVPESANPDT